MALHRDTAAAAAILDLAKNGTPRLRQRALFWIARRAESQAAGIITQAIDNDPDVEVKKQAVFALSQLPRDEGIPILIKLARIAYPSDRPQAGHVLARPIERSARVDLLRRGVALDAQLQLFRRTLQRSPAPPHVGPEVANLRDTIGHVAQRETCGDRPRPAQPPPMCTARIRARQASRARCTRRQTWRCSRFFRYRRKFARGDRPC